VCFILVCVCVCMCVCVLYLCVCGLTCVNVSTLTHMSQDSPWHTQGIHIDVNYMCQCISMMCVNVDSVWTHWNCRLVFIYVSHDSFIHVVCTSLTPLNHNCQHVVWVSMCLIRIPEVHTTYVCTSELRYMNEYTPQAVWVHIRWYEWVCTSRIHLRYIHLWCSQLRRLYKVVYISFEYTK